MANSTQTMPSTYTHLKGLGIDLPAIHSIDGKWPCTLVWTSMKSKTLTINATGLYDLFIPIRPVTLEETTGIFGRRQFKYRRGMVGFSTASDMFSVSWEGTLEHYTFLFEPRTLEKASLVCFGEAFSSLRWRSGEADFVPAIYHLGLDIASQIVSGFPAGHTHVEGQILTLLSMIFRRYSSTDTRSTETVGLRSRPVLSAIHFINANLDKPLTLNMISQKCGASVTHMRRLFRAEIGSSVWSYVQTQRLNKAAELLLTTQIKVSQIGRKCGYPDSKNFSRQFKTKYKLSPEHYRVSYGY